MKCKVQSAKCKILAILLVICYLLLVTPIYAVNITPPRDDSGTIIDHVPRPSGIDIGQFFGFGDITSLGEGTSRLVAPFFSIALSLVLIYFAPSDSLPSTRPEKLPKLAKLEGGA